MNRAQGIFLASIRALIGASSCSQWRAGPADTIGRSGNTGASAGPHLHFDVTRGCAEWGCQTIPTRFVNAGADPLAQGHTYRALPAPPG